MYTVNDKDKLKKCKGVKYGVMQRTIQFEDYKRWLDQYSGMASARDDYITCASCVHHSAVQSSP